jgi:hypothetical protein
MAGKERMPLGPESEEHFGFLRQFDDLSVGTAIMLSDLSIEEAIALGAQVKPEFSDNPIQNPSFLARTLHQQPTKGSN